MRIVFVGISICLLCACRLGLQTKSSAPSNVSTTNGSVSDTTPTPVRAWFKLVQSEGEFGPMTQITLQLRGGQHMDFPVAKLQSSCRVTYEKQTIQIEAQCWWAGLGHTYILKSEDRFLRLYHHEVEEHVEAPNRTLVKSFPLKAGQALRPLIGH